jgi:aryl carrier-like protein
MSQSDAMVSEIGDPAQEIQEILDQIAGVDVGPEISFFDLGLDSIQLMDVCNRINERYGEVIDLFLLFENPTINECADIVRAHQGAGSNTP